MFCTQCGARVDEQAKFCATCGTRIEKQVQNPNNAKMAPQSYTQVSTTLEKGAKQGFGIYIAIGGISFVLIAIVIVIVLHVTGVISIGSPKSNKEVEVTGNRDIETVETTTVVSEEEQTIIEIRELYEQKCYIEVIDLIVALDFDDFTEKQVKSILYILEESIYCYISEIKVSIYDLAEQKNIDAAMDLYLELTAFIEKMESCEITVEYICITAEELSEIQIYLYDIYVEVYYDILYQIVITGDEDTLREQLSECSLRLDVIYFEKLRAKIYTSFVIFRVNEMISQQVANEEILIFIDQYLELTGYSAYCLELWDNLFAQYREANQIQSWSSEITHVSENQYILEDSATRLLTESDISHLTRYELYVARFEIYARHGRGFADPSLTSYFENCSWYSFQTSNQGFDEFGLSDIERANIILIYQYEVSCGYYHFETMTLEKIQTPTKQDTTNTQTSAKGAMAFHGRWGTPPNELGTGQWITIEVYSDTEINISIDSLGGGAMGTIKATGTYDAGSGKIVYSDGHYTMSAGAGNCDDSLVANGSFQIKNGKLSWQEGQYVWTYPRLSY